MPDPTFSICIPNYNYGHYIGETIQSVLDQSYSHFEIIVADNASTDNSLEVVESFRSDRIRVIRNRYNIGFGPNLQRATESARNDFVNLLSSDDLMKPGALETYAGILRERGDRAHQTVLASVAEVVDENGAPQMLLGRAPDSFAIRRYPLEAMKQLARRPLYDEFDGRDVLADSLRRLTTSAVFCTTVYPRRLWQEVEGYNGVRTMTPDTHFFLKLMALEPTFLLVNRPLFSYRKHSANQLAGQRTQRAVKFQLDQYLSSLELAQLPLERYGLNPEALARAFVDQDLLTPAFVHLARGDALHALRLWSLAVATYPWWAFRSRKFYAVGTLLPLGSFARFIAGPIWRRFGGRTVPFALQDED